MTKALYGFLPLLIAFAARAEVEAATEKASPVTVLIFLILFFGSIIGYFGYMWWKERKGKSRFGAHKPH